MSFPRIHTLFVLPTMVHGGAQRTVLNLVNGLDRDRFAPILALYQEIGEYRRWLSGDVEVLNLRIHRARQVVWRLAGVIRQQKPDLLFSTLLYPNAAVILAQRLSGRRPVTIVREANHQTAAGRRVSALGDRLTAAAYRRADRVVCLSRGVAEDCVMRNHLLPERVRVIYNPIDRRAIQRLAADVPPACRLADTATRRPFEMVAVGRLIRQKGFDVLLRAVARLRGLEWGLTLIGEGEEEPLLRAIVRQLYLERRVVFAGVQDNPFAWMARADLFVLSSRWEGFGHVMVEAMTCGTPVVATRCPSGPEEIITDGVDGRLCATESPEALARVIEELAADPAARHRYGAAGHASSARFDVQSIVPQYEALFLEVLEEQRHDVRWRAGSSPMAQAICVGEGKTGGTGAASIRSNAGCCHGPSCHECRL